jgi:hypothetical protein
MPLYAFVTPVLPGKVDEWRQLVAEMTGPRRKDYEESRRKAGLRKELVWDQTTPMGDLAAVIFDTDDFEGVFRYFATSKAPFDLWFNEKVMKGIHGVDVTAGLPGGAPKPILLWEAGGSK